MTSELLFEHKDGVATVTLNRPQHRNALNPGLRRTLGECLDQIDSDPDIHVVVLQGAGDAFCAGVDFNELPADPFAWRSRITISQRQHAQMLFSDKIVIAAVQGAAYGGGASLALAADILILADDARLGFPFVHLGVVPDGGGAYLLQARVGPSVAADLLLSGGALDALEATALGLTRRVVARAQLAEAAQILAAQMSATPSEAMALTKSLLVQSWAGGFMQSVAFEGSAFGLAAASDSHRQALAAARTKRKT